MTTRIREDNEAVGVTAAAGVTAVETPTALPIHKTVLSLEDVSVTVANTTGVSFGGTKIHDMPEGRILILGAVLGGVTVDLSSATNLDAADGGDISVAGDGTLSGTDVNIIPSTSIDPLSGGITGAALAASAQLDGTSAAVDVYLNMLIDDADVGDTDSDVVLISGTLTLVWVNLGDF